jgi:hypothetical protein
MIISGEAWVGWPVANIEQLNLGQEDGKKRENADNG